MDRALDEVVRERQQNNSNRSQRRSTPRGGIRKPAFNSGRTGYDESRLWVHDKFDDDDRQRPLREQTDRGFYGDMVDRADRGVPARGVVHGTKIKVSNIHYELSEDELIDLFRRKGRVLKLEMVYDRAGRSEGTCFVTYAREADAVNAVRDYDGANANGQPITVALLTLPARGLFDRIKIKHPDDLVIKDDRRDPTRKPTPPGIDRYVPPERRRGGSGASGERTHSGPRPVREREREREGERDRERGSRRVARGAGTGGGGGMGGSGSVRPRKTVEELDAEMNDYFGGALEEPLGDASAPVAVAAPVTDDTDMIL